MEQKEKDIILKLKLSLTAANVSPELIEKVLQDIEALVNFKSNSIRLDYADREVELVREMKGRMRDEIEKEIHRRSRKRIEDTAYDSWRPQQRENPYDSEWVSRSSDLGNL